MAFINIFNLLVMYEIVNYGFLIFLTLTPTSYSCIEYETYIDKVQLSLLPFLSPLTF